jgi:hypothetical protein
LGDAGLELFSYVSFATAIDPTYSNEQTAITGDKEALAKDPFSNLI